MSHVPPSREESSQQPPVGGSQVVPAVELDAEARQLLWRCRRGMKELDVLLERFARASLGSATAEQKRAFARLLDLPDPDLADYFFGHAIVADPELARLTRLIASPRP